MLLDTPIKASPLLYKSLSAGALTSLVDFRRVGDLGGGFGDSGGDPWSGFPGFIFFPPKYQNCFVSVTIDTPQI